MFQRMVGAAIGAWSCSISSFRRQYLRNATYFVYDIESGEAEIERIVTILEQINNFAFGLDHTAAKRVLKREATRGTKKELVQCLVRSSQRRGWEDHLGALCCPGNAT